MAFPFLEPTDEPQAVLLLLPEHSECIQMFANSASRRVAESAS